MPTVIEAIFLGILQGLTEWLPVSSSAHLALAQYFFGIKADISFDIVLHIGTLLAVLVYYRSDIFRLILGIIQRDRISAPFVMLLLVAAVPTAIIGLFFRDVFESMFSNPFAIAGALVITGILLIIASRMHGRNSIDGKIAFAIGVAQGIAVAPGISRSGATISTALLFGVKKEDAAKFSFLAGILPITGAAILEGYKSFSISSELAPAVAGFFTSFVVGYIAIDLLLTFLKQSKLQWFGYYCIILAAISSVAAMVLRFT